MNDFEEFFNKKTLKRIKNYINKQEKKKKMRIEIEKMISDDQFEELRKAYKENRKFKIVSFKGYLYGETTIILELE